MNKRFVFYFISIVAMTAVFASCSLLEMFLGTSVEDQINDFEDTLNSTGRSGIRDHFHSDMEDYNAIADNTIFSTGPLSYDNANFTIGEPTISGDVATCSFKNGFDATGTITFTMRKDGLDNKILKLTLEIDGSNVTYTLKQLY